MPLLRHGLPPLLAVALLAACATPSPSDASSHTSVAPAPVSVRPTASQPGPSETPGSTPTATATLEPIADDPPRLAVETVADGLAAPIGIESAPGGWLLVNEQAGRVMAVHPESGSRATTLNLRDRVLGAGERGLLGLVLHPSWPDDPRAFVHYSDRDGNTVLSELTGRQADGEAPLLDAGSETVLLTAVQPFANHNGGQLAFGPDGHLWLGLGDGGSGGDPMGNGQNRSSLLGSILRMDVSEPGDYAIPADNPFADGSGGAREVYLYGLRNPWRFSFDPVTGALWIADVGQNAYEEIDRVDPVAAAGANLGWNVMEASHCFADAGCSSEGLVLPVTEYGRDLGCSVTGGHVYRGAAIDRLRGWYLFSDYCSGLVFGVRSDASAGPDPVDPAILAETGGRISSFGVGGDGELYVTDIAAGTLSRIVAAG